MYILECSDTTYYVGITNNLEKRVTRHNKGQGAKYTRSRTPVVLKRSFEVADKSSALKLEHYIKKRSRREKSLIIEGGLENV